MAVTRYRQLSAFPLDINTWDSPSSPVRVLPVWKHREGPWLARAHKARRLWSWDSAQASWLRALALGTCATLPPVSLCCWEKSSHWQDAQLWEQWGPYSGHFEWNHGDGDHYWAVFMAGRVEAEGWWVVLEGPFLPESVGFDEISHRSQSFSSWHWQVLLALELLDWTSSPSLSCLPTIPSSWALGSVSCENRWLCMDHPGNLTAWSSAERLGRRDSRTVNYRVSAAWLNQRLCPALWRCCMPGSLPGPRPRCQSQNHRQSARCSLQSLIQPLDFTCGDTEAQRGEAACQRPHSIPSTKY